MFQKKLEKKPWHGISGFFFLFFFFPILWCCHICYHPQEDLAKFGYKSDREANHFQNPTTVCRPICCCKLLSKSLNFVTRGLRFWRKLCNFFQFALCTCGKRLLKFATSAKFGTKRKPLHGIFKQNNDWIHWNVELAVLHGRWRLVQEDNSLFWTGTNTVSEEYGYLQILSCGDEVLWAALPPSIQAEKIGALSLQNALFVKDVQSDVKLLCSMRSDIHHSARFGNRHWVFGDGCSDRILRVAPPICKVPALLHGHLLQLLAV